MNAMITVSPDKKRAKSIIKSTELMLQRINDTDKEKYASNVAKDYYEVIRELITALLILDGIKVLGEGAHKEQIEYFGAHYSILMPLDIMLIDDLRVKRNKMAYEGVPIKPEYLRRKEQRILLIIDILRNYIRGKT